MASTPFYPPSPTSVPPTLTQPTAHYPRQIVLVLLSLTLFAAVYFGVMLGCVGFIAWSIYLLCHTPSDSPAILIAIAITQLVLCPPTALLFCFLAKNLFRWRRKPQDDSVEIFQPDQPSLFEFIHRVCDETGAPYPTRVFVNCDVNATAFGQGDSFWHLFQPTDKHLLVGLGLVNVLNLTEFKALLAHELGHFSQRSVRLGGYVYEALGVVNRIVEGRDLFDRVVEDWRVVDLRLSWPAWIFHGMLWCVRRMLSALRATLFFYHAGLRRQMELHADLVAVSVAGSDALVHWLYRAEFAERCLKWTTAELRTAWDHKLCTRDLFCHVDNAATYLRRRDDNPALGIPPALPADPVVSTQVFEPADEPPIVAWSIYPTNVEREHSAKAHYIRTEFDERPAWLLFNQTDELRAEVTRAFCLVRIKVGEDAVPADPAEIQAFIDDERADLAYDPCYHGVYDYRNLVIDDVGALAADARRSLPSMTQLLQKQAGLWNASVRDRGAQHNQRRSEHHLLVAVAKGVHRPTSEAIEHRGKTYRTVDAERLGRDVDRELDEDRRWLAELDAAVFVTHYQMALYLSGETAEELLTRYRFHLDLQRIWQELRNQEAPLGQAVALLAAQGTRLLDPRAFAKVLPVFRAAHLSLRDALHASEHMLIPPLRNMQAGQPLRSFLLAARLVDALSKHDKTLDGKWIKKLLDQLRAVQKKVERIHFKSLGGILALQEHIGAQCRDHCDS